MELATERLIEELIASTTRNRRERGVKENKSGAAQPCKHCHARVANSNMSRWDSIGAAVERDRVTLICSECGAVVAAIKLAVLIKVLNEAGVSGFRPD